MISYVALADLPQPDREKVILLLAVAADGEWRAVHDDRRGLCIEWCVDAGHRVLAALRSSTPQRFAPLNANTQNVVATAPADTSPWTIDLRDDSPNGISYLTPRNGSNASARPNPNPNPNPNPRDGGNANGAATAKPTASAKFADSVLARTPQPQPQPHPFGVPILRSSVSTSRSSPFLNARSMFLHRQTTPPRARSGSWQRYATPTTPRVETHCDDVSLTPRRGHTHRAAAVRPAVAAVRSAQWVSRLAEDVLSHVARMPIADPRTAKSVAALTSTALTTRYGALQWRRALNDFARGLHLYADVSPVCRIFRGFFVDTSPLALEDFFLFSQLRQSALRHSSTETQKVILPPGVVGGEDSGDERSGGGDSGSLFQHAIVSRRYVELRALTNALNDILTSLTIAEYSDVGTRRTARKRSLRPAEMVGVKAIVAYWIEETSGSDSLAFDLPGYVDLYEFLSTVVGALGSARCTESTSTVTEQQPAVIPIMRSDNQRVYVTPSGHSVPSRHETPSRHSTPLGNAPTSRHEATSRRETTLRHSGILRHETPSGNSTTLRHSTTSGHSTTLRHSGILRHSATLRHEATSGPVARSPLVTAAAASSSYAAQAKAILQQPRARPLDPSPHIYERPPSPVAIDLPAVLPVEKCAQGEGSVSRAAGSAPYAGGAEVQQYFAALAAIDAEIERRRGSLDAAAVALVDAPRRHRDLTKKANSRGSKENGDGHIDGDDDAERAPQRMPEQWHFEEALESSDPPAVANTFTDTTPPPFTVQRPASILVRQSCGRKDVKVEKKWESEADTNSAATLDDMEKLTTEERGLLADLRQALSRRK